MINRKFLFVFLRFGRSWWCLQNPRQPLLPTTPKVLHIIVGSPGQIGSNSSPSVSKLCLQLYHRPLLLQWKFAPAAQTQKPLKTHVEIIMACKLGNQLRNKRRKWDWDWETKRRKWWTVSALTFSNWVEAYWPIGDGMTCRFSAKGLWIEWSSSLWGHTFWHGLLGLHLPLLSMALFLLPFLKTLFFFSLALERIVALHFNRSYLVLQKNLFLFFSSTFFLFQYFEFYNSFSIIFCFM